MGTGELSGKPDEIWAVTCDGLASQSGVAAIHLVASCFGNWEIFPAAVWATRLVCRFSLRLNYWSWMQGF